MIRLQNVTKKYRLGNEEIPALNNVSLCIDKGTFLAVVGPSGSGKSTLANVIGGLDTPDSGQVWVDGQEITNLDDSRLSQYRNRTVGFVFQTFNLQAHYTALENVMVPLIFSGAPPAARRIRARECLKLVGLEDRMAHKPSQLSGGQRQRVSIARAIANRPGIVIADEPTGNLDSRRGSDIVALLRELNQNDGITLIVITHDPGIAGQANEIIEIRDGEIGTRGGDYVAAL